MPNTSSRPGLFKIYLHKNYWAFHSITHWFKRRVTRVGWMVLIGAGIAGALGADVNLSLAHQAFAFLICLLVVSFVTRSLMKPRISFTRELPRYGSVGAPLHYRAIVRNLRGRAQRGIALIEELPDPRPDVKEFAETPEPGEENRNIFDRTYIFYRWTWLVAQRQTAEVKEQPAPPLPAKGSAVLKMELLPVRRGVLEFHGVTVACPDPFGLFRSLKFVPSPQKVLILPKRYPLPPLALPGTMQYQPGGVAMASAVGESEEFVALREYRPGDPMKRIHWKSWAKTGEPIVKEFHDEFFVRHALILDTFSDSPYSEIFEEAVSVAASFACAIQTQDSLLDLLFVGPKAFCFTAGRGLAHLEQMLEVLASVKACKDRPFSDLRTLVVEHASTVSGCVCVFLKWDEERRRLVEQLRALEVPLLAFVVVPPGEADGIDPGPLRDEPDRFHVLELGRVGEQLMKLE